MRERKLEQELQKKAPDILEHGERTAIYAEYMARQFGFSEMEIESIKDAARVHDIGKLFIPKDILDKPGKLSDEEKKLVSKHTSKEIIKNLHFESPFNAYVAEHHHDKAKKMDRALAIIQVADNFDALTSKRCYREEASYEEAFNILHTDPRNADLDQESLMALENLIA